MADIQTTYRRTLDPFRCGQMANTIPGKCESGVLGGDATTSLPFGRACQWTGPNAVNTGIARKRIGRLGAALSGSTLTLNLDAGEMVPAVGSILGVSNATNSEYDIRVTAVGSNANEYTVSGRSNTYASGDAVYLVDGGPTTFAGVAVRDVTIPAANTADTYAYRDIVAVGTEGDFVVEVVDETAANAKIKYGDRVSVILTAGANFGKFSKKDDNGASVVGIPGAVFQSVAQDMDGKVCAILRLPKQST